MNYSMQRNLFERLKQETKSNISFVDEVAQVLELSNDSAYRRLRGETPITFDEAVALSKHFKILLDEFATGESDSVIFERSTFGEKPEEFILYLQKTAERFKRIISSSMQLGVYSAKDIPPFYYFHHSTFGKFKLYYWLKTMRGSDALSSDTFNLNLIPDEMVNKAKAVAKLYSEISNAEIWSEDTINVSLRQVEYFFEAGWMSDKEVALQVCNALEEIMRIMQKQAEKEQKYFDGKPVQPKVSFQLYLNDLAEMHNAMYALTNQFQMSIIGYNAQDYLTTMDSGFCSELEKFQKKQIGRSLLISGAAEKQRNKFFNKIYSKIEVVRAKIKNS